MSNYEIAFRFQDGEVMSVDNLREGLGLLDEEVPVVIGRMVGDDEWIELGDEFRAEYDPHYGEDA